MTVPEVKVREPAAGAATLAAATGSLRLPHDSERRSTVAGPARPGPATRGRLRATDCHPGPGSDARRGRLGRGGAFRCSQPERRRGLASPEGMLRPRQGMRAAGLPRHHGMLGGLLRACRKTSAGADSRCHGTKASVLVKAQKDRPWAPLFICGRGRG